LVSTESLAGSTYVDLMGRQLTVGYHSCTKAAAILTCLAAPPAPDAFRPPYVGTIKAIYQRSQVAWSLLPNLPILQSAPNLSTYERYLERPWIDHLGVGPNRLLHPADNMPNYGPDICGVVGDAACLLCLDYPPQTKERLLTGLVQIGIDNYHTALLNKHLWAASGAHMVGRKFPVLFAGLVLGEVQMLALNDYDVHEDMSSYYGDTYGEVLWTGWSNSGHPFAANVMWCVRDADSLDGQGHPWRHEHRNPLTWHDPPFPNYSYYPDEHHERYRRWCAFALPGQTIAAGFLVCSRRGTMKPTSVMLTVGCLKTMTRTMGLCGLSGRLSQDCRQEEQPGRPLPVRCTWFTDQHSETRSGELNGIAWGFLAVVCV